MFRLCMYLPGCSCLCVCGFVLCVCVFGDESCIRREGGGGEREGYERGWKRMDIDMDMDIFCNGRGGVPKTEYRRHRQ